MIHMAQKKFKQPPEKITEDFVGRAQPEPTFTSPTWITYLLETKNPFGVFYPSVHNLPVIKSARSTRLSKVRTRRACK